MVGDIYNQGGATFALTKFPFGLGNNPIVGLLT